jgi:hypothetical protein
MYAFLASKIFGSTTLHSTIDTEILINGWPLCGDRKLLLVRVFFLPPEAYFVLGSKKTYRKKWLQRQTNYSAVYATKQNAAFE